MRKEAAGRQAELIQGMDQRFTYFDNKTKGELQTLAQCREALAARAGETNNRLQDLSDRLEKLQVREPQAPQECTAATLSTISETRQCLPRAADIMIGGGWPEEFTAEQRTGVMQRLLKRSPLATRTSCLQGRARRRWRSSAAALRAPRRRPSACRYRSCRTRRWVGADRAPIEFAGSSPGRHRERSDDGKPWLGLARPSLARPPA